MFPLRRLSEDDTISVNWGVSLRSASEPVLCANRGPVLFIINVLKILLKRFVI